MKHKGVIFTIDAILALLFVILLSITLYFSISDNTKDIEKILINNRISDLLITAQHLEINNLQVLEKNYQNLFENYPGYIKINNNKKIINKNNKTNLITQNIKYINSSNKEIYIEVGVYH